MTGINTEWAIAQLTDFVTASASHLVPGGGYETVAPAMEVLQKAEVVEQILDRMLPDWRDLDVGTRLKRWELHREAAIRAVEALRRADELRQNLGDDAPEISAADLHPWVWDGARSLWQSGHFRSAVEDAAKKVNAETQNKVHRRDVSEKDLFNQAFTLDAPAPGRPRLRRMPPEDSDTYRSMQRGAMAFAEGIYAGIRNPFGHEDPKDIDEQVALEHLAALSVLARWVDDATLESAP